MTIDSDSFLRRYPLFIEATTYEVLDQLIAEAYEDLDTNLWSTPSIRDRAANLMVAHRLMMERKNIFDQGLALNALEENKSYQVKYDLNDLHYWSQTIYGAELLNLRRRVGGVAMFTV